MSRLFNVTEENRMTTRLMTLEQLSRHLAGKQLKLVAKKTGLHYNTLRKIRDDPSANPTLNVMATLTDHFRK
jgi:hypothetical protein